MVAGSLWDYEQREKVKEKRRERYRNRFNGLEFKSNIPPKLLLKMAGYMRIGKKAHFVLNLDDVNRFHAIVEASNVVKVHHDVSRGWGKKHIASPYGCRPEIQRILSFMPPVPPRL